MPAQHRSATCARIPADAVAGGIATVRWQPPLADADAERALTIADDVGQRLRDPDVVDDAVESARRQVGEPRLSHWRPEGLWQGYAGLAILSAVLDATRPGRSWDLAGREQLRRAAQGLEGRPGSGPGWATALSGVATAACALSRQATRYQRFVATLEAALAHEVEARAADISRRRPHGVGVSTFDVIAGLTGAGRYLLGRRDRPGCASALEAVLHAMVFLSEEDGAGVPHWHTSTEHLTGNFLKSSYPHGHVNLGLAHGIAGPLALLSRATIDGVEVAGQREAVLRTAEWIGRSQLDDEWGVNFPTVATLTPPEEAEAPDATGRRGQPVPSRSAWCYGAPGMARALWLAGTATARPDYRDLAVAAMAAVYRRPVAARRIDSPTVCHGVAGLLLVTLRFAHESRLPMFVDAARDLTAQLLDAHEPASRFGYRNLEPTGGRVDHPGLLDGATGVALVLLAGAAPVEPAWDRVLLLS
jgi:hypothetical protein